MAKKAKNNSSQLVINEINVGQLNRTPQTITSWQNALRAAESVLNPRRQTLYNLYHNILTDGHLSSIMGKRIRAVKVSPINFDGLEENDKLKENFQSPWMFELLETIMEKVFVGHRVVELELINGLVEKVHTIPLQNVSPELGIITKEMYDVTGWDFRSKELAPYILEIGGDRDLGLLHKLAPYVLYKRGNMADYAQYNELFGMPIRIFKYNPYDPESRAQADTAAKATGAAAYIVIPEGVEFDIKEGKQASASTTFKDFHHLMNDEMSICVLGQTLTTSNDGVGSNALGNVHKQVEESINLEDKLMTEYVLNWDFKWMLRQHGYPLEGVKMKFDDTEKLSIEKKAEFYERINNIIELDAEFVYEELNQVIPKGGAKMKRPQVTLSTDPKADPEKPKPDPTDPDKENLSAKISAWYNHPNLEGFQNLQGLAAKEPLEKIMERIYREIYNGKIKPGDVDEELYQELASQLFEATEKGFGAKLGSLDNLTPDYELLKQLQNNIYNFSGAKTYQELREMTSLLNDAEGKLRSFSNFKREALKVHETYNVRYLEAEYTAAVGNAQMARKWQEIEADKELFPYLQLDVVNDERTRHGKWDGLTAHVDHPVWKYLLPLIDWNCRCTVRKLRSATVTPDDQMPSADLIKAEFRFNPGIDKVIFPASHPYFEVAQADTNRAANNFNLPKPETELSFKQHLTGFYRQLLKSFELLRS